MTEAAETTLVTRCAWCALYAVRGDWISEAELDARGSGEDPPRITHGICPSCLAVLRRTGLSR